jgi:glutamine synthetase adenylyltransferase
LSALDYEALCGGYILLRQVDHEQRLLIGRSALLLAPVGRDIAKKLHHDSATALSEELIESMAKIRAAYDQITKQELAADGRG